MPGHTDLYISYAPAIFKASDITCISIVMNVIAILVAVASMAANALLSSRFDYCNSLFESISSFNVRKLQSI